METKYVKADTLSMLESAVNRKTKDGWKLHGMPFKDGEKWFQVLTRGD